MSISPKKTIVKRKGEGRTFVQKVLILPHNPKRF